MKLLDLSGDYDKSVWQEKGYELPNYDRKEIMEKTYSNPTWIHFGAGNIFRAFPAEKLQELLNKGEYDRGVIVAESFDHEIISKAYTPFDCMSLSVVLKADGEIEKKIVGSVTEALVCDQCNEKDFERIGKIFESESLQMISFTITEKGYALKNGAGEYFDVVKEGFGEAPDKQKHLMGRIAGLMYRRFKTIGTPVTLVSMDNCSHNGDKLKTAVLDYVDKWVENGIVEKEFKEYMNDESKVYFPWSMIDKITPRPDEKIKKILEEDGFSDNELIITDKNTYTAGFVNSEETGYLVIEDKFTNGRPPLEKVGIMFTDRETVDKVEKMKVCTCLNPLHTALAIYGCLLGFKTIHDEMEDKTLSTLVEKMCYNEGMPVVVNPGVIAPKDFANAVLKLRLPNPFMPDTPMRIATDTSQKIPIRFGETIKSYVANEDMNVDDLTLIPLIIAGWCRYLMGVDDNGEKFERSPDPRLDELSAYFEGVTLGEEVDTQKVLSPILSDETIFGINLYDAGLADKIKGMFEELISGKGSIRKTLEKYTER